MPGIASKDTTIAPIDVSQLIGKADPDIVSPRATAALGDAFRSGFVTADDVLNRVGEMGRAKEKASIDVANAQSMAAQEQTSPEAQAARAAQLGNVVPSAELQAQQVEKQKILLQYPAIAYFDKFAPIAGIQAPTLSDGTPDYKEMEKIGAEMAVWQSQKADAQKELDNIDRKDSNDGTTLFAVTKQGQFVDSKRVQQLQSRATSQFRRQEPGTVDVQPRQATLAPQAAAPVVNPDAARAQMVNAGMPAEQAVQISDVDVVSRAAPAKPVVAVSETVTATPQIGAPVAGGISLGPPKPGTLKAPTEAQQRAQLALSRFGQSDNMLQALKEAGYDPTSIGSWMSGMLPEILKSGDRKAYDSAVDAWSQGLLRLESGAAISRHEKTWYDKAFFPQVNDPTQVVASKEVMRANVERMVAEIAQQGGVVSPESAAQAQQLFSQANTLATRSAAGVGSGKNPVVSVPSGKKLQRDANGTYHYVQ